MFAHTRTMWLGEVVSVVDDNGSSCFPLPTLLPPVFCLLFPSLTLGTIIQNNNLLLHLLVGSKNDQVFVYLLMVLALLALVSGVKTKIIVVLNLLCIISLPISSLFVQFSAGSIFFLRVLLIYFYPFSLI